MYEYVAIIVVLVLLLVFWSGKMSRPEHMHSRSERFTPDHSPYGNIDAGAIDRLGTEHNIGATMDTAGMMVDSPLDNSDVIAQLVAKQGPDVFLPNGRGTTTTDYGGRGGFGRGEPSYNTPWVLPQTGTNADEMLARKQQHISSANKRATDGLIRHTSASYKKYFANELAENERKDWWSAEADTVDTDWDTQ